MFHERPRQRHFRIIKRWHADTFMKLRNIVDGSYRRRQAMRPRRLHIMMASLRERITETKLSQFLIPPHDGPQPTAITVLGKILIVGEKKWPSTHSLPMRSIAAIENAAAVNGMMSMKTRRRVRHRAEAVLPWKRENRNTKIMKRSNHGRIMNIEHILK